MNKLKNNQNSPLCKGENPGAVPFAPSPLIRLLMQRGYSRAQAGLIADSLRIPREDGA